jgi:KamA family protein
VTLASAHYAWGARALRRVRYLRSIAQVPNIPEADRAKLGKVTERHAFRANDYYMGLIDWQDPEDPIRQLIIPREEELAEWSSLDASRESLVTKARGVQHKYPDTVLLLCNDVCGAFCRYCFRKRLFTAESDEVSLEVSEGLRYIADNPGVSDVLLTGGDPLLMDTRRLIEIFEALREIPHVRIIRIGSKLPAFDPWRMLRDEGLQAALRRYSAPTSRIHLVAHFDHPRELTDAAIAGIDCFIRNGVICVNQCPLIAGVNDDPEVLAELYQRLAWAGCPPYYLFQCRPTAGNESYAVPIVRAWRVFDQTIRKGSGLARRARFVMSHESGKIEVLAVDDRRIYMRYHRARVAADRGRFLIYERDDDAYWLDQLEPAHAESAELPSSPPRCPDVREELSPGCPQPALEYSQDGTDIHPRAEPGRACRAGGLEHHGLRSSEDNRTQALRRRSS